mgnify:CR=1 FL=1
MIIRVILPWEKTSELSANSRLHWRRRAALVKAQKRAAYARLREQGFEGVSSARGYFHRLIPSFSVQL